jgi:leucyl aminopeptidase
MSWNSPMKSTTTTYDYKVTVVGTYNYVCLPHSPGMAGSFVAQLNLPLKLSSFNLGSSGNAVVLNWKTATEENTERFSIKRSNDGVNYTEIATIPAAGNSISEKVYTFSDTKLANQKFLYYNIATKDKDGKQLFSETRLFKNTKASVKLVLSLSPNPITNPGHLSMTFNAEKEGQMQVRVVNAEGKTLISRSMQAYVGVNKGHIHLGEQPSGTYTLICIMDGVTESHQILYK